MRLQRHIAINSSYSRRKAEDLIEEGRISVNGKIITEMGTKIDPAKDIVAIDGENLKIKEENIYLALYKPSGYVSTCKDTHGRKTVMDLVPYENLYPVGRLDKDTQGLLLLTNDGDFAYRLTHPKFECDKEYIVHSKKELKPEQKLKLEEGILIDEKKTNPCKISKCEEKDGRGVCNIVIHEGRKRQIRRMFEEIGNPVIYLKRIRIGNLKLGRLQKGEFTIFTKDEIDKIIS